MSVIATGVSTEEMEGENRWKILKAGGENYTSTQLLPSGTGGLDSLSQSF